jgi:multidrug efflux pump subunit AcrA (membrane-fusion protein)
VVWSLIGVTVATVAWSCLAKFEEAVPAQGKLEPKGMVQPVQAPVGGVVQQVFVTEGQAVQAGDRLLSLDPKTTQAQLASLQSIRTKLQQENAFYRSQLANQTADQTQVTAPLGLAPEIIQLTSNRAALVAENALYRAQLAGSSAGASLSPLQRERLVVAQEEVNSRLSIANLEVEQLRRQLTQTQAQLANAREALRVNQDILVRIGPLAHRWRHWPDSLPAAGAGGQQSANGGQSAAAGGTAPATGDYPGPGEVPQYPGGLPRMICKSGWPPMTTELPSSTAS